MAESRRIVAWVGNLIDLINYYTTDKKILASRIEGLPAGTGSSAVLCTRVNNVNSQFGQIVTFASAFPTAVDTAGDYMVDAVGYSGGAEVHVIVTRTPGSMLLLPDMNVDYILYKVTPFSV